MSNQIIPAITSAEDKPLGLLKDADPADVQLLKKYYTDEKASMPIPMEVFSRDIKLSALISSTATIKDREIS